jgi:hypothetical protein
MIIDFMITIVTLICTWIKVSDFIITIVIQNVSDFMQL